MGQYELEEEIPIEVTSNKDADGRETAEQQTKTVIKLVDEDQQGKVLSVQGRDIPNLSTQLVYSINQYGAKAYREAFLDFLKDNFGEFFEDNHDHEEIMEACN